MAASVIHTASQSYPPPPSFSQESADSSVAGAHLSQAGMYPFDGPQSITSTPTPTPPASRGQHQISSFNTATYPPPNGVPIQQAPPKRYNEANGSIPQQQYPPGHKPQIYTAVYSSVSVYEMEVNGVAVMRRRSDSWLNATQILKVAGIDKGKRTKVLEKEILSGEHEKVQGGYGKYQGTWINYHRGVDFCRQYGVAEILRPLLEYDMGQDGTTVAGHGNINTPTKEQAMAAQRKRNMLNGSFENRPSPQSQSGTFFQNISKTAAHAVNAINKARLDPTGSRAVTNHRPFAQGRRPSQQFTGSQESLYLPNSQQSTQSMHSDHSFTANSQLDPALRTHNKPYLEIDANGDANEPPRKRVRPSSSQSQITYDMGNDTAMMEIIPTDSNASFLASHSQANVPVTVAGLPALPPPVSNSALEKQQKLLSLFNEDANRTDFASHPATTQLSGEDFDIPIDHTAHTALHWAATLGRIHILRTLIAKGASIFRLNGGGETALMRAAITTNNYDNRTFPEILKFLGTSIEIQDGRGQTVLHHIAASSAIKGRWVATRHYLDSILEYVVGNSNAPNSQQASFDTGDDHGIHIPPSTTKPIGLLRFMSDVVNAQDMAGDTALHCAAKVGNQAMVQQLLEIGADRMIPNLRGLRPIDIPGVGGDPKSSDLQPSNRGAAEDDNAVSKFESAHRDLIESVNESLAEAQKTFHAERQDKQGRIDQTHSILRENAARLAEEKGRLQHIQRKGNDKQKTQMRIENLQRTNNALKVKHGNRCDLKLDIPIGEADRGLEVDASKLPPAPKDEPYPIPLDPNSPEAQYLATLDPTPILQARAEAYRNVNQRLEQEVKALGEKSSELEMQMRKVVSISLKVEEEKVHSWMPSLVAAVESERGEDLDEARVLELLRRVEREIEGGDS
ncbi:MAG: hypothetical protein Q9179_005054 [Wetmoreana sp. 5 TL-2023]